jgi:hypothetical protein
MMALALGLLPPALVWPGLLLASLLLAVGIMISALPFAAQAFRLDPPVGIIAPLAVLARSFVFATGSIYGLLRLRR